MPSSHKYVSKPFTRSRQSVHTHSPRPPASTTRNIIPLNTHAIRKKALKDYHKNERALDQLKDQLKQHHEVDIPGFRSWLHQAFGQIISRSRELAEKIRDKESRVAEIEFLVYRHRISEPEAYLKAQWRRAHPKEAEEEDLRFAQEEEEQRHREKPDDPDDPDAEAPWNDPFDMSDVFDVDNDDFDSIPPGQRDNFNQFCEDFFGIRPKNRPAPQSQAAAKTTKELYRAIVRNLHPDHHGQMTEARKNLWHEAQTAYARHDTEALHSILARCENGESGIGSHSPVSLILILIRRMKKTLQTTRSEIRRLKSNPAWDYQTRIKNPAFVRRIRADLSMEVAELDAHLKSLTTLLNRLEWQATHPQPPRKTPSRASRNKHPAADDDLFNLF